MSSRISDFFWPDLIEEQHRWSLDQLAMFYQTTEEEVVAALVKANEKYADDPRSTNYSEPDSDNEGFTADEIEGACGDVPSNPGKDRIEGSS